MQHLKRNLLSVALASATLMLAANANDGVRATASAILSALRLRFNIFPSQAMLPNSCCDQRRCVAAGVMARWPLTAWLW